MGTVQGVLADALEWQGINLDNYNEKLESMSSAEERAAYIQKTLTDLYGESADAYKENNSALIEANNAQLRYEKNLADLGAKVEPITTAIKNGFSYILMAVRSLVDDVDFNKIGQDIENAFRKFTDEIMPKIVDGLEWIKENKDAIIAGIVGIGTAFAVMNVANMIMGLVKSFKAFKAAQEGATVAQWLLNAAMSANPIGLIVAAIAGLVAAFVILWKKCDWFRDFWIGLWDGIKKVVATVVDWVKENWQSMLLFLVNPLAGVFKYLYDNFDGFREFVDSTIKKIKGFFVGLWEGIKEIFVTFPAWLKETFLDPIINSTFFKIVTELTAGMWKAIKIIFDMATTWIAENVITPVAAFFEKLWNGIKEKASAAWEGIKGIFSAVAGWFNDKVITPVSNFFSKLWESFSQKGSEAWEKIKKVFSNVAQFFGEKFTAAWEKVKGVFSTGGKIFSGITDGIESAFKKVVNKIIQGINKVVAIPFNAINKTLDKIRDVEIAGFQPFSGLITRVTVPEIPELAKGGVVRGATNAIIGEDGAEAVVPLEKNREWIRAVAEEFAALNKQGVVINQTNNYSAAHSRLELYKSKQQTAAAVRLAIGVT